MGRSFEVIDPVEVVSAVGKAVAVEGFVSGEGILDGCCTTKEAFIVLVEDLILVERKRIEISTISF